MVPGRSCAHIQPRIRVHPVFLAACQSIAKKVGYHTWHVPLWRTQNNIKRRLMCASCQHCQHCRFYKPRPNRKAATLASASLFWGPACACQRVCMCGQVSICVCACVCAVACACMCTNTDMRRVLACDVHAFCGGVLSWGPGMSGNQVAGIWKES